MKNVIFHEKIEFFVKNWIFHKKWIFLKNLDFHLWIGVVVGLGWVG